MARVAVASSDEDLLRFTRIDETSFRYHELRSVDGEEAARELVLLAGRGDDDSVRRLGLAISPSEADLALRRVAADLALLATENEDHDLVPEFCNSFEQFAFYPQSLPAEAAEALRWLAWQEAWHAALARAASGTRPVLAGAGGPGAGLPAAETLKPSVRGRLSEQARTRWFDVGRRDGMDGKLFFGVPMLNDLAAAAGAIARHCAACRVLPRSRQTAVEEWNAFTSTLGRLNEALPTQTKMLSTISGMFCCAAWHAANLVSQNQDNDDVSSNDEDDYQDGMEQYEFGEGYPIGHYDPFQDLVGFLRHGFECHHGQFTPSRSWRGLCLSSHAGESEVQAAVNAGFNVVRVAVSQPSENSEDPLGSARGVVDACTSVAVSLVLDLSAWSMRSRRGHDAIRSAIACVAAASANCEPVCGVALPRAPLHSVAPLVHALRANGLVAAHCPALVALEDAPVDPDGVYRGSLRRALSEGEQGLLMTDGHVVLEITRRLHEEQSVQAVLDQISNAHAGVNAFLPLGCIRFSLAMPCQLAGSAPIYAMLGHLPEELAMRHSASSNATHGWFASLDDHMGSAMACLQRFWSWPDPRADRIMWPHKSEHRATMFYLGGFNADPDALIRHPNHFCLEEVLPGPPGGGAPQLTACHHFAGLKVIVLVQPWMPQAIYGGGLFPSWYSYLTDHGGAQEDELEPSTLEQTTQHLHAYLDQEVAQLGGPGRVFIGGRGQGCSVALHVALTYPGGSLGGVHACAGSLLPCTPVPDLLEACSTTIRVFHGLADSQSLWEAWVSASYDRLRGHGDVKFTVEEGVAQGDEAAEARWTRAFLTEMAARLEEVDQEVHTPIHTAGEEGQG